jgi:hypothetical protein
MGFSRSRNYKQQALAFGGQKAVPHALTAETEEYDGTSWTAVNNMNTARITLAGCGTQTEALGFGGGILTTASKLQQKNMMEHLGYLLLLCYI